MDKRRCGDMIQMRAMCEEIIRLKAFVNENDVVEITLPLISICTSGMSTWVHWNDQKKCIDSCNIFEILEEAEKWIQGIKEKDLLKRWHSQRLNIITGIRNLIGHRVNIRTNERVYNDIVLRQFVKDGEMKNHIMIGHPFINFPFIYIPINEIINIEKV